VLSFAVRENMVPPTADARSMSRWRRQEGKGEELPLLLTAHEDCHRKEDDCSC
jgi:hypothetical protein